MLLVSICPTCNTVKQTNVIKRGFYYMGFEECLNCRHVKVIIDKKAYEIVLDPSEESIKSHNSIFNKLRYAKDVKYSPYINDFLIPYFYLRRAGLDVFNTCLVDYLNSMNEPEIYIDSYMSECSILLALNRVFPLDVLMHNSVLGINFPINTFNSLNIGIYAFNSLKNQRRLEELIEEKYNYTDVCNLSSYFSHYLFLLAHMFETGTLVPELTNVEVGMVKILELHIPDYIYNDDLDDSEFFLSKIKTLIEILNNEST